MNPNSGCSISMFSVHLWITISSFLLMHRDITTHTSDGGECECENCVNSIYISFSVNLSKFTTVAPMCTACVCPYANRTIDKWNSISCSHQKMCGARNVQLVIHESSASNLFHSFDNIKFDWQRNGVDCCELRTSNERNESISDAAKPGEIERATQRSIFVFTFVVVD